MPRAPTPAAAVDDPDIVDAAEDTDDEDGEYDSVVDAFERGAGDDLLTLGVAVVRAFDDSGRRHWEERLYEAMDSFPEYRVKGVTAQRVLGGFGALGNPSSFHHPEVRLFRRMRKKLIFRPLLAAFVKRRFGCAAGRGVLLEALFDRLCVRCEAFNRPSAEVWHRDIYAAEKFSLRPLPRSLPGGARDLIFGGWTNLDHREQRFIGLLGTHVEGFTSTSEAEGFAEFSKEEIARFRFEARLAAQANGRYGNTVRTDARGHVRIPPGHCIVFQQQLVHSVVSGLQPDTPALRVYHGLRLTTERVPLFDIAAVVENGGVPRIPSGQMAVMFSPNHYQYFATHERYRTWGERTFKQQCLYRRVTKANVPYHTPGSQGNRNRAANAGRYMPSLTEMGLWDPRYAYSEREWRAMHPQRLFRADGDAQRR